MTPEKVRRWFNIATFLGAMMTVLGFIGFATNLFAPGKELLFSVAHTLFIIGLCATAGAVLARIVTGIDDLPSDTTVWYEW